MLKISIVLLLLSTFATNLATAAEQPWKPTSEQAAAIRTICLGWRQVSRGIYMLKVAKYPKIEAKSELEVKIVDEIYSPNSSVVSKEMAESLGEQFCVPAVKEKFRSGELKLQKNYDLKR